MNKPKDDILSAVEIRWQEAVWVLGAHLYAILVPLVLCIAVYHYWDFLVANTWNPFLFYIAAGLMCAGSAFEVAQNAIDRWYLTSDAPSANGVSFCDFLFYWLVTTGQAVAAIAIRGDSPWVLSVAVGAIVLLPLLYIRQSMYFAPLGTANLLVVFLAYDAFGDPAVFLQILMIGATMYFFSALLKTGAQLIHGMTTVAASSGIWFFVWALATAASGSRNSWALIAGIAMTAVIIGFVLWPVLIRMPTSRRVVRQRIEAAYKA